MKNINITATQAREITAAAAAERAERTKAAAQKTLEQIAEKIARKAANAETSAIVYIPAAQQKYVCTNLVNAGYRVFWASRHAAGNFKIRWN